jgi:hypothetical protein
MSKNFRQIVVADFEYEIEPGGLPRVLCLVAHILNEHLEHVRTVVMWRGEFGRKPPFDIGPNTLFCAYSAWAELICFLVLGWNFPVHIFDQHTAYLAASNILLPGDDDNYKKPPKDLDAACRAYGLQGWTNIAAPKKQMAEAIGNGTWQGQFSPQEIIAYCNEDVRMSVLLLRKQLQPHPWLPAADTNRVLWWSEYSAKCVARIQARGMPVDVELWNLVQENKKLVVQELLRQFDPSFGDDEPIYTLDGEWSYERFEAWLVRSGVPYWPRLESGRLDISGDAFRMMSWFPGVEKLHALRDSLSFIVKARLPIGRDGRNRPSLFPFGTATGRNAHAKSPYNAHAGVRGFMLFPPGTVGFYLDWRAQEVGIGAALSGDLALQAAQSGDIYHALAVLSGETTDMDIARWKREHPEVRQRMKPLQLGINYLMGVPSLARGLNCHPYIASYILDRYARTYPRFIEWRRETVYQALLDRKIESVFGWPLYLTVAPNTKTLANFKLQANGAEMLRLATMRLCDAGIVPIMLVHDGILFEETDERQIEHAKEIMRQAGRDVCDGFEIGVDLDQRLSGDKRRYQDKRPIAQKMWATLARTLQSVGVTLPEVA